MRKVLSVLLVFLLVMSVVKPVAAEEIPGEKPEVKICTVIDLGYHDIWKHSNGVWQNTGYPGQENVIHGKNNEFELQLPEEFRGKYKNLRAEVRQGLIDEADKKILKETLESLFPELYNASWFGGWEGFVKYMDVQPQILDAWVEKTNDRFFIKQKIDLINKDTAVNLTKENERNDYGITLSSYQLAHGTEGYRWYIPTVIDWYGVEEDLKPVDLLAKLDRSKQPQGKIGQTVTLRGWVKNLGSVEQATDYTWWLPDTSKYDLNPTNLKRYKTVAVTLGPGEEKEVTMQYKIPNSVYTQHSNSIQYRLEVNSFKNKPADEPNWINNFPGPMYIKIIKPEPEPTPPQSGSGLRPPVLVE
jgi:hypothetical protein